MSGEIHGAEMVIGRDISSAKEKHFFLTEDCSVLPSQRRNGCQSLKQVLEYTRHSYISLIQEKICSVYTCILIALLMQQFVY